MPEGEHQVRSARILLAGAVVGLGLAACGGSDGGGLGLVINTNGVAPDQTFELRIFAGGATCPASFDVTTAQTWLAYLVCPGNPTPTCAVRENSLAAGQQATLKDIPTGACIVFITSPQGNAPTSAGCAPATVSSGQFADVSVSLSTLQ